MPAAERAEFEALLADDQAAREALAAAVELFAAVPLALSAAGPQDVGAAKLPAKPLVELTAKLPIGSALEPVVLAEAARRNMAQRRIWTQRWAWASLGAAACLVAILGITAHRNGALSPDRTNGHEILPSAVASDASSDLGLEWTNLSEQADSLGIGVYAGSTMLPGEAATSGNSSTVAATNSGTAGRDSGDSDTDADDPPDVSPEQLTARVGCWLRFLRRDRPRPIPAALHHRLRPRGPRNNKIAIDARKSIGRQTSTR